MPAVGFTVRRIDYRDAPSCRGLRSHHTAQCPLVGYAGPAGVKQSLRRTVREPDEHGQLVVRFDAPVAVTDASSHFLLKVGDIVDRRSCRSGGLILSTDRNYAADEPVTMRTTWPPTAAISPSSARSLT